MRLAPELARRLEWWLVTLIAAHTYAVGVALLAVPGWALRFGGWEAIPPLFFPRQAGVFHLVLGTGYLAEFRRSRGVVLLLTAKACATVFLLGATLLSSVPWFVTFAGVADGLMGASVLAARAVVSRVEARRTGAAGSSS
ncbi:MAG TPA: hypothetical protein VMT19_06670 [Thermoanaerobaculaceae bacterium]|nr:hypothetical protein [Thermoanaerobaculaceae bacterium]